MSALPRISAADHSVTHSHASNLGQATSNDCQRTPQPEVGISLRRADDAEKFARSLADRTVSDDELELHIANLGQLLLAAHARYEASSCFTDLGEARRWLMLQNEAIGMRSAAQVARMEAARGLE